MDFENPKYNCILFDLDDTLYPLGSGIASAVGKNIRDYMSVKLGVDDSKIAQLSNALYKTYGTTLAGLRAIGYDIDYDAYHSFVHGRLPYENLKPDPVLRNLLLSLPCRKLIFTNGDKVHAAKVLNRLGLEDCFKRVICFETMNQPPTDPNSKGGGGSTEVFNILQYLANPNAGVELPKTPVSCKPSEDSFMDALKIANAHPQQTIFFDDSVRNIQAAKNIGLHTVLVGTFEKIKGADYSLESIHNIREALPELWVDAVDKIEGTIRGGGKVVSETSVKA